MRLLQCFCMAFIAMAMLTGCGKMQCIMHGNSMKPALKEGDLLICDTNAYSKITDIQRWNIIAYHHDFGQNRRNELVAKRVVGLPGDKLDFKENAILLNGSPIMLPEGIVVNYKNLIDSIFNYLSENDYSVIVPADCVFTIGDNAVISLDSRYYGPINFKDIFGKVTLASPETKTPPKTGKVKQQ